MKKTVIHIIKLYQRYLSPIKGTKCPYYPSCSEYGIEAVERYGAFFGGILSLYRIIRCNPFSKGGVDPVPDITVDNYHKLLIRRKS
ncbi:MAG: membrane protein insertion efficiency factor YidD [Lachnospiraceae bacterium]|nr:membrane protein insertion efficiency factor YidD [Lachnospiraceae bacterium]